LRAFREKAARFLPEERQEGEKKPGLTAEKGIAASACRSEKSDSDPREKKRGKKGPRNLVGVHDSQRRIRRGSAEKGKKKLKRVQPRRPVRIAEADKKKKKGIDHYIWKQGGGGKGAERRPERCEKPGNSRE